MMIKYIKRVIQGLFSSNRCLKVRNIDLYDSWQYDILLFHSMFSVLSEFIESFDGSFGLGYFGCTYQEYVKMVYTNQHTTCANKLLQLLELYNWYKSIDWYSINYDYLDEQLEATIKTNLEELLALRTEMYK